MHKSVFIPAATVIGTVAALASFVSPAIPVRAQQQPITIGKSGSGFQLTVHFRRTAASNIDLSVSPSASFSCKEAAKPFGSESWMRTCTAFLPKDADVKMGGTYLSLNGPKGNVVGTAWLGDCDSVMLGLCSFKMNRARVVIIT